MAAAMRIPEAALSLLLILLFFSFTFPPPVASVCVPRNSTSTPSPTSTPSTKSSSPSPSPKSSGSPPPAASIADAIDALCSNTDYKDLCVSSTRNLFPAIDAEFLLRLEMKAIRSRAEQAKSKVTDRAAAPGADGKMATYLRACAEQYDDACSTLDEVEKGLTARDKGAVSAKLSAVLDSFATCEDGFAEAALVSPMAAEDEELQHLASNCLVLADIALK